VGIFEAVGRGTVFLDEIHTLSLGAQQRLLRALQEKKVRPVGSSREYPVHFRLVAASKPDLDRQVERGKFLPDLYYRLNVLNICVPALRERLDDLPPLIAHFCDRYEQKYGEKKTVLLQTLSHLERYPWPGNVRELENLLEYLCIRSEGSRITPEDLDAKFSVTATGTLPRQSTGPLRGEVHEFARDRVVAALRGSKTQREAARKLGLAPSSFHALLKRYGLWEGKKEKTIAGVKSHALE
jgi:DNA-binding NtrC family response regulator